MNVRDQSAGSQRSSPPIWSLQSADGVDETGTLARLRPTGSNSSIRR